MGRRPDTRGGAIAPRLSGFAIAALLLVGVGGVGPSALASSEAPFVGPDGAGLPAATDDSSIAAAPPIEHRPIGPSKSRGGSEKSTAPAASAQFDTSRTIAALVVVVALIFLVRWGLRKTALRMGGFASQLGPGGRAPSGVLAVLARYPVGRGQTLVLLQLDQRILLLNQSSDGFRPLAEITDPEEVASLIIKTRDEESESLSSKFTGLLKSFERDPQIVNRNEWPSRNPTTIDAAMRLFPDASATRNAPTDPLASVRRRLADLEGGAA